MKEHNSEKDKITKINTVSNNSLALQEVDNISITILMDNFVDFLLTSTEQTTRPSVTKDEKIRLLPPPIAEHGFSALVKVEKRIKENKQENYLDKNNLQTQSTVNTFLFDTGISENGIIHNAKVFGVNISEIDGIILSHGHFDHFGGLLNTLRDISINDRRTGIDLFLHPDSFLKRWEVFSDGKKAKMPFLDESQLEKERAKIHKNKILFTFQIMIFRSYCLQGKYQEIQLLKKDFHSNM